MPPEPPSVAADFAELMPFLKKRGIVSTCAPSLISVAKKIHASTYSLILWRFRIKNLPAHGKVFINEIASDALQILPQTLMGYGKTASLLTRGIIENTLRHVYFSDHPVEFFRMNRDNWWFMTMEELFKYVKLHPLFVDSEPKFDAINRLNSLYSELSADIHGRTVNDLEMRIALKKIAYDNSAATKQSLAIGKCAALANFMLAIFHREKLASFQAEDRRVILRTMPTRARQVWSNSGD
jgi:hypothetical protein